LDHVTFWISLLLRPKIETKRLNLGLRWSSSLLTSSVAYRWVCHISFLFLN